MIGCGSTAQLFPRAGGPFHSCPSTLTPAPAAAPVPAPAEAEEVRTLIEETGVSAGSWGADRPASDAEKRQGSARGHGVPTGRPLMPRRVHPAGGGRRDSPLSLPDKDGSKLVKFTGGVFKVGPKTQRVRGLTRAPTGCGYPPLEVCRNSGKTAPRHAAIFCMTIHTSILHIVWKR